MFRISSLFFICAQMVFLAGLQAADNILKINGQAMPAQAVAVQNGNWSFSKSWKLTNPAASPKELNLGRGRWRKNKKYSYIVGYNGNITLKIEAPQNISQIQASAKITNFADSQQRKVYISYSTDGAAYTQLSEADFKSGSKKISAQTALQAPAKTLWIRFGRKVQNNDNNGKRGFVLFNQLSLNLKGGAAAEAAAADGQSQAPAQAAGPDLTINDNIMPGQAVTVQDQNWTFSKTWKLDNPAESPEELNLKGGKWRKNKKYSYIVGYNGDITLKINASKNISGLKASAKITNFADSKQRKVYISYSTDGAAYTQLSEADFKSGSKTVTAQSTLQAPVKTLWIRFGRQVDQKDYNGNRGFVVFNQLNLNLTGK